MSINGQDPHPLAPQPMTPEQIADLVERVRESHRVMIASQRKAVAASRDAYRIMRRRGYRVR